MVHPTGRRGFTPPFLRLWDRDVRCEFARTSEKGAKHGRIGLGSPANRSSNPVAGLDIASVQCPIFALRDSEVQNLAVRAGNGAYATVVEVARAEISIRASGFERAGKVHARLDRPYKDGLSSVRLSNDICQRDTIIEGFLHFPTDTARKGEKGGKIQGGWSQFHVISFWQTGHAPARPGALGLF